MLFCVIATFVNAQNLYWIGGSGSFNDPHHWSLVSGGSSANRTPSALDNVVFDDNSGSITSTVTITSSISIGSFNSVAHRNYISFSGSGTALHVSGSFFMSSFSKFNFSGNVIFKSVGNQVNRINFGANTLNANLFFKEGNYALGSISQVAGVKVVFDKGNYKFRYSTITTDKLEIKDASTHFQIDTSMFTVRKSLLIKDKSTFTSSFFSIHAPFSDSANVIVNPAVNFGSDRVIGSDNSIFATCGASVYAYASCGNCTGIYSLSIDPACTGTYNIIVSNSDSSPDCANTVSNLSANDVVAGTYTFGTACFCAGSSYGIFIYDPITLNVVNVTVLAGGSGGNFNFNPTSISLNSIGTFTTPLCNTSCNGAMRLLPSGGTSPWVITMSPAILPTFTTSGTFSLSSLCGGLYTFTITDTKGCSNVITKTLTVPSQLNANPLTRSITCTGACNGTFSISPNNTGTSGYTVNFNPGGTFTTAGTGTVGIGSLCPGPITATVTDRNGCTVTVNSSIAEPPAITVTPTQTNVTCAGFCNGTASVNVSGGIPPYTYSWSAGSSTLPVSSTLCAGSYTVNIKDNNNCVYTPVQTFSITQPSSITITPTITNAICHGLTGSAVVSTTGGIAPVTFTWVAPGNTTVSTTPSLTSVAAGSYTVYASDGNCIVSRVIPITEPASLTITAVTQSIACIGVCSGAATVNVSGGNGIPFTYTWSSVPAQNASVAVNLCAGTYSAFVRDAAGCPTSTIVTILQPTTFTPAITSSSLSCNGVCNGTIGANPTGGTAPYNYTLTSATATLTSAVPNFINLCAGVYTLSIRDAGSPCPQNFTVTITQPAAVIPSISTTSITCFNQCNGVLTGNAIGGVPGYTYNWITPTGPVSGGVLSDRCIGNYTLNVTDSRGCVKTLTTALSQPPDIAVTINPVNVTCFSACNGVLSANVTGGTPGYTLNWSNGFTGVPNTSLCVGTYTLIVNDLNGCIKTGTAAITSPGPIALTETVAPTLCAGSCDGSATVAATGGVSSFTYAFNTFPVTTNTTGNIVGLCAGNYIANATDGNGCNQSVSFSITSPIALSAAISNVEASCSSCTGASTVTASNGAPGYSYAWTNSLSATVSATNTAAGLCPGNYTVVVTDIKNCSATASVNIAETVVAAPVSGGTGIQCFGACTASAVVSPNGGSAPYSYTWQPTGQTTQTATALCAGVYTVYVKEGSISGCISSSTINILSPPALVVNGNKTDVSCFGACNGSINVTASGGTGAYSYSWSPGGQTTQNITNLCAGTYSLKVTDANGCTSSIQTFTISEPLTISATFTTIAPTTCTTSNGGICAQATGGSGGPYTYTWLPSASNATCINGLAAGAYSLIIADGVAGCTNTLTTLLNNPNSPTLTLVSSQSVSCFGGANGAATFSATGTAPYTYSWTPAVSFTTTGNTSSATGLQSGLYIVSAEDANSCVRSQILPIVQATSVTVTAAITNPKCNNAVCNGSIVVSNPTGGTPGYTFSWSPGGITSQNLPNVCAGNYTLTITDSHACPNAFVYAVAAPPVFTITTTSSNIKCNGVCNGSIVANASGGTAPVSYNWPAVGAFTGSTTATVLNLCANIYTVNALDGNGCVAVGINTIQITEPAVLNSTLTLQNASCSNSCNAVATLTATGGISPYSFSWSSDPATTPTLGSLCAGNYTGNVVDANGCVAAKGFTVIPPATFAATLVPANPKCNPLSSSVCSGSVATFISGAQGAVSYSWSPVGSGQSPVNLCSGSYTLTATDANSCHLSQVVNLVDPPALLSNITFTNPACNGVCNGIAITTPTNAIGAVSVTWTPSAPNSPTVTNLCAGNYTVHIADNNGCTDVQTFTLQNPPALNINTSNSASSCTLANGAITAAVSGGSPGPGGYVYVWSPAVSTTSTAINLAANIYTLVVSDALNCTNTVVIPLSNANGPTSAPIISSNISCNSQCTGAASINPASISGGTPGYTISWLVPPSTSSANPQTNLCAGIYTAKIADANNCTLYNSVTITQPNAVSTLPSLGFPSCMGVCNGSVSLATSGGTGPYTYTWMPGMSTTSLLTNACPGNYTVLIGYGGASNCTVAPQTFVLPAVTDIAVTTSITPNQCFGDCNGTAIITSASGVGSSQFNYAWSNGQNGETATNFCNGTYTLIATAPNGCINSFNFAITSPSQITSNVVTTQPGCGQCNGTSVINASGGVGPTYTYSWTTGATVSSVSNLCAGLYEVVVTDVASSCVQTETVIVNNSNGITGETFNTQNIVCANTCNGSTTVTAIGGTQPITYSWINPVITNSVLTNLCAGVYFVQMSDAQGCLRTSSVNISATSSLSLAEFIQQPNCLPPTTGSIAVIVTGGTPAYTYSWQPTGATTSTLGNLTAGNYSLTVTDASTAHCTVTQAYNISNLAGPVVTFTQTNIKCFGTCVGAITAVASGTGTPTFSWSNGSTSPVVTNLCAGIITLTVTGANGCVTIKSFTITENPALQINAPQITQPTCNLCNGGSTITPFGGVLPYTYSWTTNSNSPAVSNLCAGLYEVTIADGVACQETFTILINNSNGIAGQNFNVQNILCGGNCNGSASVTAVGGTSPISYTWINPAITNSVITNLCAGIYYVQMSDAQNCIRTASVEITAATSVSVSGAITSPACTSANGSVILTISGGTPGYGVTWSPGSNITPTLSGIAAGSYTAIVHDTPPGTCTVTEVFNVSNATGPVLTYTQANVKCFGTCTGSITLNATVAGNPSPNLNFNWSNGINTAIATGLCQGVITVTVTDMGTGCKTIKAFTITENSDLNINSPTVTQPSCNMCNGAANVSVFGGVAPYQYVWTNNSTSPAITDLCAGLYQVQVTDAMQCSKTHNILINSSSGITGENFNIQNIQCANSCNGAATVTAIGGSAPVQYSWVNPATTGPSISSLCAGNYFVQMTDALGCIRTASVAIAAPNAFTVSALVIPPTCGVSPANGSVNVTVTGGSGLYQYSWTPSGSTAPLLTNVAPGVYTVVVTDAASGCSLEKDVNVSNPTGPDATFVKTDISCFGSCTGSITGVSTSTNALTYSWSAGIAASTSVSSTVTGLCKGVVTVTVTDNVTGCQTVRSFNLGDNTKLQLSAPNVIQPSCHNTCDGQITLLPSGGSLPYVSYNWTPTGNNANPQTGLCAGDSAAIVYTVVISDSKGCTNTTTIQLTNPPPIALSFSFANASCSSVADGSIGITPAGGTPTYSTLWTGPSSYTANVATLTNLYPGTYSLNLVDTKGCMRDTTINLISTVSVQAMAGPDATVCPTGSVVLSGTSSAGTGTITFNWFLNTTTTTPVSTADSVIVPNVIQTAQYILQVNSPVPGCFARDTVQINVQALPVVSAGPTFTIPVYSTVTIGGDPTAFGNVTIAWTPTTGLSDPTIQNPVASNTIDMTYTVTVTDNTTGCMASDMTLVSLYPAINPPSGFSPNSDGKNDRWIIDYIEQFPENTVEVYNRWGERLFQSQGYNVPFDGRFHNKDLPVGTYYYIINLNHPAYPKAFTGPLTIFR